MQSQALNSCLLSSESFLSIYFYKLVWNNNSFLVERESDVCESEVFASCKHFLFLHIVMQNYFEHFFSFTEINGTFLFIMKASKGLF